MLERGREYLDGPWKRSLDVGVSTFGLLVSIPIIGGLSLIKYLEDREYPLFVQERVGRDGNMIKIIKIRSMRSGDESDEVRVTNFGRWLRKTRLDELPQFYLVLIGEMSMVGTRPMQHKVLQNIHNNVSDERYCTIIQDYKDQRSGVTGIWQVIGSGYENDHKIYHPNRFYLENANLILDLKIIYKTAQKVFNSFTK